MTGLLRGGETASLTFGLLPTISDTAEDPTINPETVDSVTDPAFPSGDATATFDFDDSCGNDVGLVTTDPLAIDPHTTDIDITKVSPDHTLVSDGEQVVLSFLLVNDGDAASVAEDVNAQWNNVGNGWSNLEYRIKSRGSSGGENNTGWQILTPDVDFDVISNLEKRQGSADPSANYAYIEFRASANNNGQPLSLQLTTQSLQKDSVGASVPGQYEWQDTSTSPVLGFSLTRPLPTVLTTTQLAVVCGSANWPSTEIVAEWFGGIGGGRHDY